MYKRFSDNNCGEETIDSRPGLHCFGAVKMETRVKLIEALKCFPFLHFPFLLFKKVRENIVTFFNLKIITIYQTVGVFNKYI